MRIKVTISGRLYDVSGSTPTSLELPTGASVDDALEGLRHAVIAVMPRALLAVSGDHLGTVADHTARTLVDGDELLIFSPVAGG